MFFFEKKNQKTFLRWAVPTALPAPRKIATPRDRGKVFLLLFLQKKKVFSYGLIPMTLATGGENG